MPYCPKCGKEVKEGDQYCPNCGQSLSPDAVPTTSYQPRGSVGRPAGITMLSILEALGGFVFLLVGLLMLAVAGLVGRPDFIFQLRPMLHGLIAGFIGIMGAIIIIIGLIDFAIAYGYWSGKGWAWTLGMISAVLGILLGLIALPGGIFRIMISCLVIYYLTRPHVKTFLGK